MQIADYKEILEAVRDNSCFKPDCKTSDHKLEYAIITILKEFPKQNGGSYELLDSEYFTDYSISKEYDNMIISAHKNKNILYEMKDLIWKLHCYYLCRLCRDNGAIYYDWRTIVVDCVRYLPDEVFNKEMLWQKKYESIVLPYARNESKRIIGEKLRQELFIDNYFSIPGMIY